MTGAREHTATTQRTKHEPEDRGHGSTIRRGNVSKKKTEDMDWKIREYLRRGGNPSGLYFPGGRGGDDRGRGSGASAVVLPHRKTSDGCSKCGQFHSTAEHARHGEPPPATKTRTARKTKKRAAGARTKTSGTRKRTARTASTTPTVASAPPATRVAHPLEPVMTREQVVLDAIPSVPRSGRYGERKVFIAALHDRVVDRLRLSPDEFKRLLIDMNRRRLITLARADLVAAMPADLLRRSEISDRGADFHFVIDEHSPDLF